MWCTSSHHRSPFDQPSLVVDQVDIKPSLSVRDLGVQLRADLSVADHDTAVIRSGYYNISQLRQLRSSMTREALRHAAYALVLSRVDYCNSLYANAPATSSLINMAARVVSGSSRFDHITDFARDYLHWLSIWQWVDFKICSMVFKVQHDLSSIYITEMMKPRSMIPRRQDLRPASRSDLIIPKHRIKFAEHAFIVAGPVACNRLPQTIHEAPSLTTFRRLLKTYLFEIAYSDSWLCTIPMRISLFWALY